MMRDPLCDESPFLCIFGGSYGSLSCNTLMFKSSLIQNLGFHWLYPCNFVCKYSDPEKGQPFMLLQARQPFLRHRYGIDSKRDIAKYFA